MAGQMELIRADRLFLDDADLQRLAARYGLEHLERLGGFENVILRSPDSSRIVRVTHTSRRSLEAIEAEVAFMDHLASNAVPVVGPIESIDGHLVETHRTEAGDTTIVYCMIGAPGSIREPGEWSEDDIVAYGDLLGRAHAASTSYDPGDRLRRPEWVDPFFDPGMAAFDDREVVELFREAHRRATEHPAGGTGLLIHQDAHVWNLHVDTGSRLTLFDFDDCGYATAEHDVAIVLFYWLLFRWPDLGAELRRFLTLFLSGYERHATLADDWPEGIDRIMKVRETEIFLLLSMEDIDANSVEAAFMEGRRQRLRNGTPYLGAPLESLL